MSDLNMKNKVESLEKEVEILSKKLKKAVFWIPEATPPKAGEVVICIDGDDKFAFNGYYDGEEDGWFAEDDPLNRVRVDFWMPKPNKEQLGIEDIQG